MVYVEQYAYLRHDVIYLLQPEDFGLLQYFQREVPSRLLIFGQSYTAKRAYEMGIGQTNLCPMFAVYRSLSRLSSSVLVKWPASY